MRVIQQLIDHLRGTGQLTPDQLVQLRQMGLLKDKSADQPYPDTDYVGEEIDRPIGELASEDTDPDGWDDYTDRLLNDARRVATGRRKGACRSAAGSDLVVAIEESMAEERALVDLVLQVARRMDPEVDADDAPRLVACVDPAGLDAVLARDGLWARLWRHIAVEPIVSALDERARRRFSNLVATRGRSNKSVTRQLLSNAVFRRAVALVEAHRALSCAFGRIALAVEPWRAFAELNLCGDPTVYEVLVILYSARTTRHTVAELPYLAANVGLPTLAWLPAPRFVSGWAIAARIDPVAVLPFMRWCMGAWSAMPADHSAPCRVLHFDDAACMGNWIPQSSEWFGLSLIGKKRVRLRCITHVDARLGEPTQSIIRDGVRFVQVHPVRDWDTPRGFFRVDAPENTVARWSSDTVSFPVRSDYRGSYGAMWAAGLVDMPVLTCPKEWELK